MIHKCVGVIHLCSKYALAVHKDPEFILKILADTNSNLTLPEGYHRVVHNPTVLDGRVGWSKYDPPQDSTEKDMVIKINMTIVGRSSTIEKHLN